MKSNYQKAKESTIKSGIRVLQNKLLKLGEDITYQEETIRLNCKLSEDINKAKVLVAEKELFILNGLAKQLNTCIYILEESL